MFRFVAARSLPGSFSYTSPLGRTPAINVINYTDSPIPTYLAAQGNPDPEALNQAIILGVSLEMSRFDDNIVYDPTISLTSLFVGGGESPSPASLAPGESASNQAISTGGIIGIIIAAVVVVGIVMVSIFVPPVRKAIQPFFRGRNSNLESAHSQESDDTLDADEGSRDKSNASNGWVASKKPR